MKKYILAFILIAIIIYFLYFVKEQFLNTSEKPSNLNYLDKNELENILIENKDKYYNTFNTQDLAVRDISNISEYYEMIRKSVRDGTPKIINRINRMIVKISLLLNTIKYTYFAGDKALTIVWNIGFVDGTMYELGLPHTRNNIIILPIKYIESINNKELTKLLIHEFIHVYQKTYPQDIINYLKENNYVVSRKRNTIPNIRANPDLDHYVYKTSSGEEMYAKYRNNPSSIRDVDYYPDNTSMSEHPYEEMAYKLADILVDKIVF